MFFAVCGLISMLGAVSGPFLIYSLIAKAAEHRPDGVQRHVRAGVLPLAAQRFQHIAGGLTRPLSSEYRRLLCWDSSILET